MRLSALAVLVLLASGCTSGTAPTTLNSTTGQPSSTASPASPTTNPANPAADPVTPVTSDPSPAAPVAGPTSPTPPAGPAEATLKQVWLCCGANGVGLGVERQMQVRATYTNGSIVDVTAQATGWWSSNPAVATVSPTGVIKGITGGDFELRASFGGMTGIWPMYVPVPFNFGPAAPDEVMGHVREITPIGPTVVYDADVEVVGGPLSGLHVKSKADGIFRISGLQAAGFDLIIRRSGYSPTQVHVSQLGVDLTPETTLNPDPSMARETIQGEVCTPGLPPLSASFTPTASGFMRITAVIGSSSRAVYGNGVLVRSFLFNNEDLPLQAGVQYELRVTGTCEHWVGPVALSYLRPR